jgi:hypothetical protein
MYVNLVSKLIILYEVVPLRYKQVNSAMHKFTRGENGSGIPVGYRIRVVQIPVFSDTDSGSFIFGTDTGNTWIL